MKILLDENLPKQLKADFGPDYDVKTVQDMGWLGKKPGSRARWAGVSTLGRAYSVAKPNTATTNHLTHPET